MPEHSLLVSFADHYQTDEEERAFVYGVEFWFIFRDVEAGKAKLCNRVGRSHSSKSPF